MTGTLTADKLINYELPYNREPEVFDFDCFERVGQAMGVSLLDFIGKNPMSRL